MRWPLLPLLCLLFLGEASGQLRLPAVVSDHMVLQRESEAPLFGWAAPGATVVVTPGWGSTAYEVVADGGGRWKVAVRTPAAGGPFDIRVVADREVVLRDVLVGEVWVCSGQSNMEWTVARADGSLEQHREAVMSEAKQPQIRLFTVKNRFSPEPQDDCQGAWSEATPKSVRRFSAVGWFFGRRLHAEIGVPIGLISSDWGGTPVESWMSAPVCARYPALRRRLERVRARAKTPDDPRWQKKGLKAGPREPSVLFNGMIAPLLDYRIRGAIWYQGESNRMAARLYRETFPAMIADWRARWGQGSFPFYYVQIAPFGYRGDRGQAAALREAQEMTLRVANTGMAVTMDIGNPKDIHPRLKRPVGERLAAWALNRTYGKANIPCSGPVFAGMVREGGRLRLRFEHADGGLVARGGPPSPFLVAGGDARFVPAMARIEGDSIVVWSDAVRAPRAVRFAWGAADEPNLFNGAGLPASSFRSDDLPEALTATWR